MIKLPYVSKWLKMPQNEVLDKFQGLTGSFTDGKGQERFVYVPGTRKDRVLLVAHSDTVWSTLPIKLSYADGILFSGNRNQTVKYKRKDYTYTKNGIGIGADDRAGCAIVWKLRDLGHSLLITSGEESGCIAAKFIMSSDWWRKELANHQFAVEFDRRGKNDIVFYDVGTNKFVEYVKKETGYTPQSGSVTDISHLCRDICGVNMSVGYYSEHTSDERLVVDQWINTYKVARKWLSSKDIEKFPMDSKDKFNIWGGYSSYGDDYPQQGYGYSNMAIFEYSVKCDCGEVMGHQKWYNNMFNCTSCGKEI